MSALLQNAETFYISTPTVTCDGDKGSAHPRVFLTVNAQSFVDCPYCGKHYELKEGAAHSQAH